MAYAADRTADYRQPPAIQVVERSAVMPTPVTPFDDRELPAHLKRRLAPVRPTTDDPIGRRIAFLLHLHPEVDQEIGDVDLRRLRPAERRAMLSRIEERLSVLASA